MLAEELHAGGDRRVALRPRPVQLDPRRALEALMLTSNGLLAAARASSLAKSLSSDAVRRRNSPSPAAPSHAERATAKSLTPKSRTGQS